MFRHDMSSSLRLSSPPRMRVDSRDGSVRGDLGLATFEPKHQGHQGTQCEQDADSDERH